MLAFYTPSVKVYDKPYGKLLGVMPESTFPRVAAKDGPRVPVYTSNSAYVELPLPDPQTRAAVTPPGASAHGRLDYVFYRLPEPWTSEVRKLREKYGSDYAPLVGAIRFVP